ncbi:MAG: cobalamin-binding protein [Chloroflexi bacterium]|nr:cobalamin-binding protein [Chloroflexota bacterium]
MSALQERQELLHHIRDAVVDYDEEVTVELCSNAIQVGLDAYDVVANGLALGMEEVGQLYEQKEYFVPEVLMCSDAFYAGLQHLKPHIRSDAATGSGQVIIGTVEGDVHDIGKNLVKLMLEAAGFVVHDLGKDVPLDKFVQEQQRTGADIIALSALMTTSMLAIPVVIEKMRAVNPNVKILIGGAPVSQESVDLYGADGYAETAARAVDEARRLLDLPYQE